MKRSTVNALIREAEGFFRDRRFMLPPWSAWTPRDWAAHAAECAGLVGAGLGWDLTDFGSGDFHRCGLLLFTLRNGRPGVDRKPYAEKIMIVREAQRTPMHFHRRKMEDIINRGGGDLVLRLFGSTPAGGFGEVPVRVEVDGVARPVPPGGTVVLAPGQSIALEPGLYHEFHGAAGRGMVLVGEVSSVNDDVGDNCFKEPAGRFPDIDEDEPPYRLLVSDYAVHLPAVRAARPARAAKRADPSPPTERAP